MAYHHPLIEACTKVLESAEPDQKIARANQCVALMKAIQKENQSGPDTPGPAPRSQITPPHDLPDRPARPKFPVLVSPIDVPKRKLGSPEGRGALLHAIAHIEFNAIDLAFDMAARFAGEIENLGLDGGQFLADWIGVGGEEALHFSMVENRLRELGTSYGEHPAHDGLWEAALETSDMVLARLAIAPMVLEARGLDVTPGMIAKLQAQGDSQSAAVLERIYTDEIGHVQTGTKWFRQVCKAKNCEPIQQFQALVSERFKGQLKEPFNHGARAEAGIELAFYQEWTKSFA